MAGILMARLAGLGTLSADLKKANAAAEESRSALVATQDELAQRAKDWAKKEAEHVSLVEGLMMERDEARKELVHLRQTSGVMCWQGSTSFHRSTRRVAGRHRAQERRCIWACVRGRWWHEAGVRVLRLS
jgi:hypothetical protein